jgi:uncharacterized protein YbjT (DUF2867 family)/tryptophan-rich sensory protein
MSPTHPASDESPSRRSVLVTGATGHVGSHLVPALLERGHSVRVLSRSEGSVARHPWAGDVDVAIGDVTRAEALDTALADVEVAYYLVHSMDGQGDFRRRDLEAARTFADAAARAGVGRIVYLSGLHPEGELSEHLASRVEVGDVFLGASVPAAVLQAGIVLGRGSASFDMLRHLTERLPAMVTPRWIDNRIQPIALDDVVHFLVAAADVPPDSNRTWDIGGPEVLTYREMMQRYARVHGLRRRLIVHVPVLTPSLASHWVSAVTPVEAGIARPLVGSLVHDAVCSEDDALSVMGPPPGGLTPYDDAVRRASEGADPRRWGRTLARTTAMTVAAAGTGSLLTKPDSAWYLSLDKPAWQPPALAFPVVWSALYADIAVTSALTSTDLAEGGDEDAARAYERALAANLVLNAAWSGVFFRARRPALSFVTAALLAASSADLARRAAAASPRRGAALTPYAAWCGFATLLSGEIARRNPGGRAR